jgi:hypothetical protein
MDNVLFTRIKGDFRFILNEAQTPFFAFFNQPLTSTETMAIYTFKLLLLCLVKYGALFNPVHKAPNQNNFPS